MTAIDETKRPQGRAPVNYNGFLYSVYTAQRLGRVPEQFTRVSLSEGLRKSLPTVDRLLRLAKSKKDILALTVREFGPGAAPVLYRLSGARLKQLEKRYIKEYASGSLSRNVGLS